ncbi:uncharacterized protein LOC131244311 [Magnolia sinica]|uniref:uncharacterized protein LOC131244311 n=1 Tax=Magnolia sinica TaxID=86752 RepID=UPI00265A5E22|nr:uncharacterized protein LOC131244311 [Magnolia sinica]
MHVKFYASMSLLQVAFLDWVEIKIVHLIGQIAQAAGQISQSAVGGQGQYAPAVAGGAFAQPRPTGMVPQAQPVPVGGGLDMQGYGGDDEETQKLRAERGRRAGGWTVELSKRRAFEEAFGSIWI